MRDYNETLIKFASILDQCQYSPDSTQMINTAIMCCYGRYDILDRSPAEIEGLDQYLDGVMEGIEIFSINTLVLAGGFTNTRTSEAESNAVQLESLGVNSTILLEESSLSTAQNIAYSITLLKGLRDEYMYSLNQEVIIFCDMPRYLKCAILASVFCSGLGFKPKVIPLKRKDIHPNNKWYKQLISIFPELSRILRYKKRMLSHLPADGL